MPQMNRPKFLIEQSGSLSTRKQFNYLIYKEYDKIERSQKFASIYRNSPLSEMLLFLFFIRWNFKKFTFYLI